MKNDKKCQTADKKMIKKVRSARLNIRNGRKKRKRKRRQMFKDNRKGQTIQILQNPRENHARKNDNNMN